MFEEESLCEGVLQLAGVALDIDGVEARNGREIIDPAHKAIVQLRLNGVAQVAAEKALQRGRLKSRTSTGGRSSKLASRSERLTLPFPCMGVVLLGIWLSV